MTKFTQILSREWESARVLFGTLAWTRSTDQPNGMLLPDDLELRVNKYRLRTAIRFEGRDVTYYQLDAKANHFAHFGLSVGLQPGDHVALVAGNSPEYIACWYGFSKIGVTTALINNNLTCEGLAHSLKISKAKFIIAGAKEHDAVLDALSLAELDLSIYVLGEETFETKLHVSSASRPDRSIRAHVSAVDPCLLVFTSGTTGLPKAALISHMRVRRFMRSFIAACHVTPDDVVFLTLPLYHATGGLCGVGAALMTGACLALREGFSASQFWKQAIEDRATVFVYIGELCRYLINQPQTTEDKAHSIRTGFGNGLAADVWQRFVDRFGIPKLKEFYGSTEGNVGLLNLDGKIGAAGRVPPWMKKPFANIRIVKFDEEKEMPSQDKWGCYHETAIGEVGEVLGRIGEHARTRFDGYSDANETKKKIISNAFDKGDLWFRTGDLMYRDKEGYFYFVDRVGDTFRWKGENVSTNEVASVLSSFPTIDVANVYGVQVPGYEGKAGMAALTTKSEIDFEALHAHLSNRLPKYAHPQFLRLVSQAALTATFKLKKHDLVEDGFDPSKTDDLMWSLKNGQEYEPLTDHVYQSVVDHSRRL